MHFSCQSEADAAARTVYFWGSVCMLCLLFVHTVAVLAFYLVMETYLEAADYLDIDWHVRACEFTLRADLMLFGLGIDRVADDISKNAWQSFETICYPMMWVRQHWREFEEERKLAGKVLTNRLADAGAVDRFTVPCYCGMTLTGVQGQQRYMVTSLALVTTRSVLYQVNHI